MSLNVAAIVFDHTRGLTLGSSVPLRYDAIQPVLLPEWQLGQHFPAVAAYAIKRLAAVATVIVRFVATPDVPRLVELRALAESVPGDFPPRTPLLGNLPPQAVSFDPQGFSTWHTFAFNTAALVSGVDCTTLQWRWQARLNAKAPWLDVDVTLHRIYALLDVPSEPWNVRSANRGDTRLPRTDMLDLACLWARGARDPADVATRITQAVNRLGGRHCSTMRKWVRHTTH